MVGVGGTCCIQGVVEGAPVLSKGRFGRGIPLFHPRGDRAYPCFIQRLVGGTHVSCGGVMGVPLFHSRGDRLHPCFIHELVGDTPVSSKGW